MTQCNIKRVFVQLMLYLPHFSYHILTSKTLELKEGVFSFSVSVVVFWLFGGHLVKMREKLIRAECWRRQKHDWHDLFVLRTCRRNFNVSLTLTKVYLVPKIFCTLHLRQPTPSGFPSALRYFKWSLASEKTLGIN